MIRLMFVLVLAMAGLFLATTASAQQPKEDTIEIATRDDGCTIRVNWTDGEEDATHLRVSINAIEQPVVPVDDFVGDQDATANPLATYQVESGNNQINARLYTGGVSEERQLHRDTETHRCTPPAATPTPSPSPTPTSIPATPAPTSTPVPPPSLADQCAILGGIWVPNAFGGFLCKLDEPAPQATQAPAPQQLIQCADGSTRTVQQGCPAPAPVRVGVITPPSTGDGGLLACVDGYEYIPHFRLVIHYDEYGSYGTFEFWYWEVRRCTMYF